MQMIDEGFHAWYRKYSALALLVIGALSSAWAASPEIQEFMGPQALAISNGVLAVLGFVGRFIKQTQAVM
jgi:hypothetical protein